MPTFANPIDSVSNARVTCRSSQTRDGRPLLPPANSHIRPSPDGGKKRKLPFTALPTDTEAVIGPSKRHFLSGGQVCLFRGTERYRQCEADIPACLWLIDYCIRISVETSAPGELPLTYSGWHQLLRMRMNAMTKIADRLLWHIQSGVLGMGTIHLVSASLEENHLDSESTYRAQFPVQRIRGSTAPRTWLYLWTERGTFGA